MSFDDTRRHWRTDVIRMAGLVLTLGLLAWALPGPVTVVDVLIGGHLTADQTGAGGVGDAEMLVFSAIVVWLLLAWIAVIAAIAGCSRLPGVTGRIAGQVLRRAAPPTVRRVLLSVVGASVVTAVTACGTASSAAPVAAGTAPAAVTAPDRIAVEGSAVRSTARTPDRIPAPGSAIVLSLRTTILPRLSAPATSPAPPVDVDWPADQDLVGQPVVVLRGDSLWSIAAKHLPATATQMDIERSWHQWYAANAALIGNNPNLILPGQILSPPSPGTGDSL